MAINFNALPTEKFTGKEFPKVPGKYRAYIENAEIREKKDKTGHYLNLTYKLETLEGKPAGKMYDIIPESDKAFVLYKIGRFLQACGIPLEGSMELADIGAIVIGRQILVDVEVEEFNGKQRYVTDSKTGEIYYLDTANADTSFMNIPAGDDEEMPF